MDFQQASKIDLANSICLRQRLRIKEWLCINCTEKGVLCTKEEHIKGFSSSNTKVELEDRSDLLWESITLLLFFFLFVCRYQLIAKMVFRNIFKVIALRIWLQIKYGEGLLISCRQVKLIKLSSFNIIRRASGT